MNQYVYLHEDTLFHIFSDISLDITSKVVYKKTKTPKKLVGWFPIWTTAKYYNAIK